MGTTTEITNSDDIIDSRDVIARIAELEGSIDEDAADNPEKPETAGLTDDEVVELETLRVLAEQGEYNVADWEYGAALVRESHFEEYAEQLAEDIGAINHDMTYSWPLSHIDWEAAANALKVDYTQLDFDGVTYWAR